MAGVGEVVLKLPVGHIEIIPGSSDQLRVGMVVACDVAKSGCVKLAEKVILEKRRTDNQLIVEPSTRSRFAYRVSVTAYKGDLVNTYFEGVDSGWSTQRSFTPNTTERVYLKLTGSTAGDYEIGYVTTLSVGDIGQAGGMIFYVDEADAYADWDYLELVPLSAEVSRLWGPSATDITLIVDADSVDIAAGCARARENNLLDVIPVRP